MSKRAHHIANQIQTKLCSQKPQIAIILGSGLGDFANQISNPTYINYSEIEDFPTSTVTGHQGRFVCGELSGKQVLCLQGRVHPYEGYPASYIADIIKALKLVGISTLIVTNAAGSLKTEISPGSLMLITDHINMSGFTPLIGANDETFGPRFPNMNNVYTKKYQDIAKDIAQKNDITLHQGVYCMLSGPAFETPAEVRMCAILGADANGMSTVPETMTACYCGMNVLGISAITNYCTGVSGGSPTHAETLENAAKCSHNLTTIITQFIGEL
ncbi:MAG: purine-nucleoside phosphorylase [Alphaproteobacteria bacterium]|nr:purine-nucleoside phosphorylase [Alphaproteobacteria bacterium]